MKKKNKRKSEEIELVVERVVEKVMKDVFGVVFDEDLEQAVDEAIEEAMNGIDGGNFEEGISGFLAQYRQRHWNDSEARLAEGLDQGGLAWQ